MIESNIITGGILLTLSIMCIYLTGRYEKERKRLISLCLAFLACLFLYLFLNKVRDIERGNYYTESPKTNTVYTTASCVRNKYFAYFMAVKQGDLEPRYFRKKGKCPPFKFTVNENGKYIGLYFIRLKPAPLPEKKEKTIPRI